MLFEGIALCLCAPVMSYVLGKSLFDTGVLTIALATCAMLWNMLYNAMFERVEKKFGFKRSVPVRIGHAVGFEGGLVLVVVLLAAWWLSISYWDAFLLEMGLIAFFLPYTYVYNLVYDKVRERLVRRGDAGRVSEVNCLSKPWDMTPLRAVACSHAFGQKRTFLSIPPSESQLHTDSICFTFV